MASSSDSRKPEPGAATATETIGPLPADRFPSSHELRIGEIVLAAAGLDPGEREEFLRRVTVEEPGLLEEARHRLQKAAELPSAFLAVPAAELLEAAERAAEPPAEPSVPVLAGAERYTLGECLGRGGMARVYKAFDRQLHRPVAIKLLERADPKTLRRFLREAQAQARVRHEYVLEVYETGELGGQPYIAMHYVDGPTLMGIRDETSLEQKIRLMAQVAEGLHAAHREGLIHRDVKPSNILVEATRDGKLRPWVADFGIATQIGGGSSIWSAVQAGTPYYLAPERLTDDQPVDRRSDVYSLGVTLYQFLSGKLPFQDPSLAEMLRRVREEAPASLAAQAPGLPAELEAVVMKCLAKDPNARYPSARALAEDLWRYLDGERVEAHTATFTYRLAKAAGHKRALLTAAWVAAALLIAFLTAFAISTTSRARRATQQAVTALDEVAARHLAEGRYDEAEEIYRSTLALREENLGPEHASVAGVLSELALLEIARREYGAAEAPIRRALDILGHNFPATDWRRAQAKSVLATCLAGRGLFADAEALLLESYPQVRDQTGADSPATRQVLDRVVALYEAWGRDADATHYRVLRDP